MAELSLLQQICASNKSFLEGTPRFLDSAGEPFLVHACIDPRLTGLLEPALGLPPKRVVITRTAGNLLSDDCHDALRSIAVGVFLQRAREVFVVGHTDCALSRFSAPEVIESFRGLGIPRSAFGNGDLRTWFGAFSDIKGNVIRSVNYLRRSGILPGTAKIHGLIIGTDDARLEIVVDGDVVRSQVSVPEPAILQVPQAAAASQYTAPIIEQSTLASPPPLPGEEAPRMVIVNAQQSEAKHKPPQPTTILEAAKVLSEVLRQERRNPTGQKNINALSALMKRERNPAVIYRELERVLLEYQRQYPKLPGALAFFRKYIDSKGFNISHFMEILKRILS